MTKNTNIVLRLAVAADLPSIIALLADDALGKTREQTNSATHAAYRAAFDAILADSNNEVAVADLNGGIIGVLQYTHIPSLTYQGRSRGQVEGVRVAASARGHGVGKLLLDWAIERARSRGCHMVQLTTDKRRPDALRFYESLGFSASHEGMKLHLSPEK